MYFDTKIESECSGCEACVQSCPVNAIHIEESVEGFRYPVIEEDACIHCGLCRKICSLSNMPQKFYENKYAFGGYHQDADVRFESTSGGAFSAIVEAFCDQDYAIFGAATDGLNVYHDCIFDRSDLPRFRKSKYCQSVIGTSYKDAKKCLLDGKKVLFSGTPCQIAGLRAYLGNMQTERLLTVEVICEGVPSPLYVRKYEASLQNKYGSKIKSIDYRYTGKGIFSKWKWDFEKMKIDLVGGNKTIEMDRWFNPFWSIWLGHLMSRPSCYECRFAEKGRCADISLGDLWGVHLYCPELYGDNGGASLIVANTEKGIDVAKRAQKFLYGHELEFEQALKYQSPMRKHIDMNDKRGSFMQDLQGDMTYEQLVRKWYKGPGVKLLWQKYIWGNRQKITLWKMLNRKGR